MTKATKDRIGIYGLAVITSFALFQVTNHIKVLGPTEPNEAIKLIIGIWGVLITGLFGVFAAFATKAK
jgi:hypothetical protein